MRLARARESVTGAAGAAVVGAAVAADVVLTADLDCTGPALVVTGSGITVDLDGHRIRYVGPTGEGVPPVVGVHVDGEATGGGAGLPAGVTVRDGRVEGYPLAVAADNAVEATVAGLDTEGAVRGFRGHGLVLRDSRVGDVVLGEQLAGARPSTPPACRPRATGCGVRTRRCSSGRPARTSP